MVANTHTSNQRVRRSAATFKLTPADDRTTFTDSGADFQAYMVGWLLQPDVELPSYLEIVEVDESSGNWVGVKGDADTLATSGSTYRLHAPPGVDRETGALITGLEEAGSHWLWAGYEYVPPMVGFADPAGQDPGTYGAQSGENKVGSYHCWNRVYEPATGRWTTPDCLSSSWLATLGYANERPLDESDGNGQATGNLSKKVGRVPTGNLPKAGAGARTARCCCITTEPKLTIDKTSTKLTQNHYGWGFTIEFDIEWKDGEGGECKLVWLEKVLGWYDALAKAKKEEKKTQVGTAWEAGKGNDGTITLRDVPNIGKGRERDLYFIIVIQSGCPDCKNATFELHQHLKHNDDKASFVKKKDGLVQGLIDQALESLDKAAAAG